MIDDVNIHVSAGNGGDGSISGRREKYVPRGGPDGGNGGDGGNVIIKSDPNINTLISFTKKKVFVAGNGLHGLGRQRHGKRGDDVEIMVPTGTVVWDGDNRIADMALPGEAIMVAAGGIGGRGNAKFARSTNQFPLFAEKGEIGQKVGLRLELKLLADVGIIGVPNAGKSTFLTAVTSAKPKIAEYPFTTLEPVLGVIEHKGISFVMVDIPGLIEGAHQGIGLGHEFLRHVQRTRVLVHVIDGSTGDITETYSTIRHELEMYGQQIATKPEVIGINKIDIPGAEEMSADQVGKLKENGQTVHLVSALTRKGLGPLLDEVVERLDSERNAVVWEQGEGKAQVVLRPKPIDNDEISVSKKGRKFFVSSKAAARIAETIDSTNWEARIQLYEQFRRMGVTRALEKAGIKPGNSFQVGSFEMEWGLE